MAIAYDAGTNGGFASGTSRTFSHTCTGTDRFIVVHVFINTSSNLITGVTYAGVAMTLIDTVSPASDRRMYVYRLANPASGANNVVISASSSTAIGGNAVSYTGVDQTSPIDNFTTATSTAASIDTTLTTVADNCWTVLAVIGNNAASTASTNSTLRVSNGTYADGDTYDNNAAITPAGSYTMTVTTGGSFPLSRLMFSIKPAGGAAPTPTPTLMMMGIGT